jgi:hypothetical protein
MPFILPPLNQDVLRAGSPQLEDLEGDDVWTVSLSNLDDLFADSAPLGSKVGVITFSARIIQSDEEKLTPKTFGSVFSI